MTKKRLLIIGVLALAVAGAWITWRARRAVAPSYRLATVERTDLEATVSATGKLGAVSTVQVGTQVSGQVSEIHVDFNDRVTKGQLIARIDPILQQQAVRDAQAGLERAQAELEKAQRDDARGRQLYQQGLLAETDFNAADYAHDIARASLKSAQVALERARQNLDYTSIYAPIDGIVVERNVDVGQTVAASLSAPQLFLIANDLSRLQILAAVDESDIGQIEQAQPARFTVQAYPNERFTGTVRQVRLQSTTTENVVNYTAVVEVDNPGGKLLPGMTATVDFLTGSARDVLTVPNAALRFRPDDATLAAAGAGSAPGRRGRPPQSPSAGGGGRGAAGTPASAPGDTGARAGGRDRGGNRPANAAVLWVLDAAGQLAGIAVRTGLTDGQRTEVSQLPQSSQSAQPSPASPPSAPSAPSTPSDTELAEGMQVVVGVAQAAGAAGAGGSPFATPARGGAPRPGGF